MAITDSGLVSGGGGGLFGNSASPYLNGSENLGRDEFLKLLVTQLQHQDPLNPMDSTEFTSQLAQYSSLEQLVNVNKSLKSIDDLAKESLQTRAIEFLGNRVKASGKTLYLPEDTGATGGFSIDEAAECTVLVKDEGGRIIKSLPMGRLEPGFHRFEWDGDTVTSGRADSGVYDFEVQAFGSENEPVDVATSLFGTVSKVDVGGENPVLYVGDLPVALSEVIEIEKP